MFEVLEFSQQEWHELDKAGLILHDLAPNEVSSVLSIKTRYSALSVYDCFSLVTSQVLGGTLLTGDKLLRRTAASHGVAVHGVLWLVDHLMNVCQCPKSVILSALEIWKEDRSVFLPQSEITNRLAKLL